jgi:hypothetical protein
VFEDVSPVDLVPVDRDEALVPSGELLGVRGPLAVRKAPLAAGLRQLGVETLDRLAMGGGVGDDLQRNPRVPRVPPLAPYAGFLTAATCGGCRA